MAKILCTGSHPALIELRKAVLEGAGHTVVTIVEPGDVAAVCNETSFDVAIIGQSIGPESRGATASAIRQHCASVKILELYPWNQSKGIKDADAWLEAPVLARDLIQCIAELSNPKLVQWPGGLRKGDALKDSE